MADFESTMEWKVDITSFTKAMREAKDALTAGNRQFDLTVSTMEKWSASASGLEAKIQQLKVQVEAGSRIVEIYRTAWEQAKEEFGEASPEAERLQKLMERQQIQVNKAQVGIDKYSNSLNEMNAEQQKSSNKYTELNQKISDQQTRVNELKEQYAAAVLQFGKTSDEARELATALQKASNELAENKQKMSDAEKAADKLDDSLDEVAETASVTASDGFTVLKGALANLVAQGINRAIDGFKTLAKNAINYMGEIEQYEIAFEVMTGSAEKASEIISRLGEIVKTTPFDMPTLASTTQLLMNYGISADEAVDKMMMLGDISQGNSEKLGRVALAYGQMNSAGKVLLQDLKQMIEAGFNPLQEISERTGESMASLYDRISKGTISVDEINEAFVNATSEGGKYYQSMDKQSQSLQGRLEALKEQANETLGNTFQPLLEKITSKFIPKLIDLLAEVDTSKLAKGLSEFGDSAMKAFDWIIKNGGEVVDVFRAIAISFVTYKATTIIGGVVSAFATLVKAIKAGETAMKAMNLAFGATPIGLIALAVAGLAGGIAYLTKKNKEAIEAQYGLNSEQQAAIDKVSELADTYRELDDARQEQLDSVNGEFNYIKNLKDEYNGLIDANGKVKEGYEDRASFILSQLAEAMGVELEDIQKLIDANGKLSDSIDEVILKKQAEAVLSANEQVYNEAIKNRTAILTDLAAAQTAVSEADEKRQETQAAVNEVMEKYQELLEVDADAAATYMGQNLDIINANQEAQKSWEEASAELKEAEDAWIGYNSTIQNYEGLAAAIISGDVEQISSAMQTAQHNIITAETGNRESLERQLEDWQTTYDGVLAAVEAGTISATDAAVAETENMVNLCKAELDKLPPEAEATGAEAGSDFANSIGNQKSKVAQKGAELVQVADTSMTPAIDALGDIGDSAGEEFGDGVGSSVNKTNAKKKAEEVSKKAIEGLDEADSYTSGSNFGEGYNNGIGSWIDSVWQKAKELAKAAWNGLKEGQEEGSPSKLTRRSGVFFGQGYELGIEDMINPVKSAASKMAKQAVNALGVNMNAQMREIGVEGGNSLIAGFGSIVPNMASSIGDLKASVAATNAGMLDKAINVGSFGAEGSKTQNVTFNQYNTSPKALNRLDIYRNTNSLLFSAKVRLNNV